MTIIHGFRAACEIGKKTLQQRSTDNRKDAVKFRADLINVAKTTLSSKILTQDKELFSELAVDAILRLKGSPNLDMIHIIKKSGGTLRYTYLDEGFILDKSIGVGQPKRIENARILVANTPMDTDKIKIYGAKVRADSMMKVAEVEAAEKNKMKEKVEAICAHGCNVFVNRQLIYDYPQQMFADAGMMGIEHADFDGVERLGLVTGADIVSTFDTPNEVTLGVAELVEEMMIGEDTCVHFKGVAKGEACTIVLRGASTHVLDEAERSLHDALCVLAMAVGDSRVLPGGGYPEMQMAQAIEDEARKTAGKQSLAMQAYADALRNIPAIICDNAGMDSAEIVAELRATHAQAKDSGVETFHGVDVISGTTGDMQMRGVYESFKVKNQVLMSATEAAEMILRVDDIIKSAPRQREQ